MRDERNEWAAQQHEQWAKNYRYAGQKIRDEWTGPDYSSEDNRANHADAREHFQKAGFHDGCARAFRALIQKDAANAR